MPTQHDVRAGGSRDRSDDPDRGHLASQLFNLAMIAIGVVALWWMIHKVTWDELVDAVGNVGWWFVVILGLDIGALCLDAAALHAFMQKDAARISYVRVLGAQASGRAINVLTPGGALGEATKLTMLDDYMPRARVLSSLLLLNLAQFYLSVLVIVIGTPIVFLLVDIPASLKIPIAIGFAVLVPLIVAIAVIVRRGALSTVVGVIRRTRIISAQRAKAWKERTREIDRHIRELESHGSHGTWTGIAWIVASKLVTWTSTILLLVTAGVSISPALIIGVLSIGVLIQWIAQIVPMGLGLADGGNFVLYERLGAEGALGFWVTNLNRARSVAVAVLGLGAMATLNVVHRTELVRRRRRRAANRAAAKR